MSLKLTCPQCAFSSAVPDQYAGKQAKCPKCGALTRIPNLPAATSAAGSAAKPAPQAPAPRNLPRSQPLQPPAAPPPAPAVAAPAPELPVEESPAAAAEENGLDWLAASAGSSAHAARSPSRHSAARSTKSKPGNGGSSADPFSAQRGHRRRRSAASLPGWVVPTVVGVAAIGVCAGLYFAFMPSKDKPLATKTDATSKSDKPAESAPKEKPAEARPTRPGPNASPAEVYKWIEAAVVMLEVHSDRGGGKGTGFVIDPSGIVATNYHVMKSGDRGTAQFNTGEKHDIEGYVAAKPEWDVALVKLKTVPANLHALELLPDAKPEKFTPVMAIGYPKGYEFELSRGVVTNFARSAQLGTEEAAFVSVLEADQWIEHDAFIEPGNSGGPLLDARGDVLGVNTWVVENKKRYFALSAWYVREAQKKATPTPEPLSKYMKVEPPLAGMSGVRPDELEKRFTEWFAAQWKLKSVEDFWQMQDLVRLLVTSRPKPGGEKPSAEAAKLGPLAEKFTKQLAEFPWTDPDHIEPLNKWAVESLGRPLAGVFAFATAEPEIAEKNSRVLMLKLPGSDRALLVQRDKDEPALAPGSKCLVLGIEMQGYRARHPQYGDTEFHVIRPGLVLPLGQTAAAGAKPPDSAKPGDSGGNAAPAPKPREEKRDPNGLNLPPLPEEK